MTAPSSRDPSELRQKGSFGLDLGGEASTARGATPWALGLGPWAPTASAPRYWVRARLQPCAEAAVEHQGLHHGAASSRVAGSACPASLGWRLAQGRDEQGEQVTSMSGSSLYEDLLLCVPPPAPSR